MALDPLRCLLGQSHYKLLQHHLVDDLVHVASLDHQPSAAGVPELLSHHEWVAALPQIQQPESLAMLLRGEADSLEDGSLEVFVNQVVLNRKLLSRHLCLPGQ